LAGGRLGRATGYGGLARTFVDADQWDDVLEVLGRELECERIRRGLACAREGMSDVLVICGEAGIGKTALLRYAAGCAGQMIVLEARGVEA
jgi:hypothetical protein